MTAARSEGLGIVPIVGIRWTPSDMIELLQLPDHTFPVAGVAMALLTNPPISNPGCPSAPSATRKHITRVNYAALFIPTMKNWFNTGKK